MHVYQSEVQSVIMTDDVTYLFKKMVQHNPYRNTQK